MHELSLAQSLIGIVLDHADRNGAVRVNRLVLSFGRMSCIEPRALETAFAVTAAGTRAEGACLSFTIHPVVVSCLSCEREYTLEDHGVLVCPSCGDAKVVVVGGTEDLELIEMEVDAEE